MTPEILQQLRLITRGVWAANTHIGVVRAALHDGIQRQYVDTDDAAEIMATNAADRLDAVIELLNELGQSIGHSLHPATSSQRARVQQ